MSNRSFCPGKLPEEKINNIFLALTPLELINPGAPLVTPV